MKVCVTGATGFIGSRLALRLQCNGLQVVALGLVNNSAEEQNKATLEAAGVEVVVGTVTEKEHLPDLLNGCEQVYHLAAAQHEANMPDEYFYEINVEGTRNILDAAVDAGVKRFVHGSTIGVYGNVMYGELDEASLTKPANIYGITKLKGEQLALSYVPKLPVIVIRISETYGPGDRRLLKLFKGVNRGTFFVIGNGTNLHQPIYVDDLIDGMRMAAATDKAIGEVFILAGQERLGTNDMCAAVARAVSGKPPRWRFPLWIFLVIAVVVETLCKPLGIQAPLHQRRLDFFRKSFYFSNNKVENLLGFFPKITFDIGTQRAASWYQEKKLL